MEIQLKRDAEFVEVERLVIQIGNSEFRLEVNKNNELVINKFSQDGNSISIRPVVSNEIIMS